MSAVTTHVLDTRIGSPAADVSVLLERRSSAGWTSMGRGKTNSDGRLLDLLPASAKPAAGIYRLTFDTAAYFKKQGVKGFYPSVAVAFEIADRGHYHIPLLLNPFGYTTYRGS